MYLNNDKKEEEENMRVRDFIKWLETQDQDAIVEVVIHDSFGGYYNQGGTVSFEEFDPEKDHSEYVDFRGNPFVNEDSERYGKRLLLIGYSDDY